jgi:hypothetical protein
MELRGQNIYPTTFAPHVWHLRGKLGVNLPHLPHHPNRPMVTFIVLIINYEFQKLKYVFTMEAMFHLIKVHGKIQSNII